MDRYRIGRLHRRLRQRLQRTQREHATSCSLSRYAVMDLEAGDLERLRVAQLQRSFSALGADVDLIVRYHGAAADRLLDEAHALLVAAVVATLQADGWEVQVEVSYSEYGERGSIDILAWHAPCRALLVVEVKSELGGIDVTLRPFDAKCRLAPRVARERFGWQPAVLGRVLVLPDARTARRNVERHAGVLRAVLPARSRELRTWLRNPTANIGAIWLTTLAAPVSRNPSSVQRVRRARRLDGAG